MPAPLCSASRIPAFRIPAPLLACVPLLFAPAFAPAQLPTDDLAPPVTDPAPPIPDEPDLDPFDDPPADPPPADPFAPPPPAEPSVGGEMRTPLDDPPRGPLDDPPRGPLEDPPFDPLADPPVDPLDDPPRGPLEDPPPRNPLLDAPQAPADPLAPVDPLEMAPEPPAEIVVPLDPADPRVKVIEDPAVTVLTQPNPLAELIRNPYDIYDLREHAAVPAACLLARQDCLPCTRCVTRCLPCGAGVTTESLPVPGVNPNAAEAIAQILLERTPADPRVSYLLFVLRHREGRYEEAFGFLEEAIKLEQANPDAFPNYGEFMTPIQGRSRVYLERVRRLAGL